MAQTTEVWQRGPVPGVPPLLQPVAHALLQAVEEVDELMQEFPDALLWEKPAGLASPGFHLLHMAGVLDRLFTYAAGEPLSEAQLLYLNAEPTVQQLTVKELVQAWEVRVQQSLGLLKNVDENNLTQQRTIGRKALPTTLGGLLFHGAEHTMRHLGQLLVTAAVLRNGGSDEESVISDER